MRSAPQRYYSYAVALSYHALASYEAPRLSPGLLSSPEFLSLVILCLPGDATRRIFKALSFRYLACEALISLR